METSEHSKRARVLFDEAHSESWSIRTDVAERMQASHPADASLASAAEALERRDFEVRANATAPIDGGLLASTDVLVIAHPSEPQWEATTGEGEPRLTDAEIEAIGAWVEAGGGLIVLGETEQEKYGNNLNELLGRFGIEIENTTVQDYERHRGEAPSWILADLVESPDAAGADPLAGVTDACFYRAGTLALSNGARVIARTSPSAAPPTAPLAAVTRYGAGRVVVLADSDLFGDDCIDELDHESFWVNLAYFAAEPAFGAAGERVESAAAADPAWQQLRDAVEELRAHEAPDGSIDAAGADEAGCASWSRRSRRARRRCCAHFPHQGDYIARARRGSGPVGRLRVRRPRLPALDRGVPAGARPSRRDRAPRRLPDVQAERISRHLLRGADRPGAVAALGGRAREPLRQRQVPAGRVRRLHLRLRLRVRRALPGDVLGPRSAPGLLRRDLLRPRGGAPAPGQRQRRRDPAAEPAARRRLPARLAGAVARCLHRLGSDPRPHPHARRSAVRSVHDPPAQPLLDVLAGGAALRPDRVRGGGEARGRGLRARPSRPVRDPLRPAVPLPAHRRPGPQLRRPRRAAAVRVPPPRGLPALDRQPAGDRVGEGRRGRRQAPRARRRALPLRHRPLEARAVDRRSRSGRHLRPADRGLGLGQGPARPARGRGAEAARRSRP